MFTGKREEGRRTGGTGRRVPGRRLVEGGSKHENHSFYAAAGAGLTEAALQSGYCCAEGENARLGEEEKSASRISFLDEESPLVQRCHASLLVPRATALA